MFLNTCLMSAHAEKIIFFDPDIKVFNPISFLYEELDVSSIILTPHICTPIVFDNKKPDENHFLNFGIYNLGFIGLKKDEETKKFLSWWKQHTYHKGYIDVYKGIFVDQLPVNLATIFFKNVKVLNSVLDLTWRPGIFMKDIYHKKVKNIL